VASAVKLALLLLLLIHFVRVRYKAHKRVPPSGCPPLRYFTTLNVPFSSHP